MSACRSSTRLLYRYRNVRGISTHDHRHRLSSFWTPTASHTNGDGLARGDLLERAGLLRQAHAGIYHLLPLGLRVQDKIERLISKHMRKLGASAVSLSSITSEKLWKQSGRFADSEAGRGSEFFRLTDRKDAKYLLSPTHEEEITSIVANAVQSHKDLPLRLYQITKKYRDEARPRHGLLRAREFVMKDLYTFDTTEEQARHTYDEVRIAYRDFFEELGIPYLVAAASSGTMGGSLSHEYHLRSHDGEDTIISCGNCDFAANEEIFSTTYDGQAQGDALVTYIISKDRTRLYKVLTPSSINMHVVKKILPDADTGVEDPLTLWTKSGGYESEAHLLLDPRCGSVTALESTMSNEPNAALRVVSNDNRILLTRPQANDPCPQCKNSSLVIDQAVEIGHTFHLGTRYSQPLKTKVNFNNELVPVQMGCHGIGVSRLIAAVSGLLVDDKGLNWPLSIAPFQVTIFASSPEQQEHVNALYDSVDAAGFDPIIDDRAKPFGYKIANADLVGYPFIVILGRKYVSEQQVELQCRRLGIKENVSVDHVVERITQLSNALRE